ncbi:MAG: hypothetical protein U9R15_08720 [Chloroflexota bacterium]|nr:hypothetical protein [Chloroflexota bacterium]
MSEAGEITNISYPALAKKGARIAVTTTVKNTGTDTAEFRVYFKDPEGRIIDKEPDTYRSVKPGASTTITTSDILRPMPGYDWNNLKVELWEIDLVRKTLLHTRTFSIKLDTALAENGEITNISYPASAKKGAEIEVSTTVKNTGRDTAEFRVYLKNPEGRTIDKEPDTYRSVKPGASTTIKTSTSWDPIWAMPGYDWNNLKVELWEIDVVGKTLLGTRTFSIKLDKSLENGKITNVQYPAFAYKGAEVVVDTSVMNIGSETAEFRIYLKSPGGRTIDKEPDTYRSVKPGYGSTLRTSTHWDPLWAMPGYDWNLSVELWEIDLIGKTLLGTHAFTVKHKATPGEVPEIPPPDEPFIPPPPGEEPFIPPPPGEEPFIPPPPGEEPFIPAPPGEPFTPWTGTEIVEITPEQAEERYQAALPSYLKCTLPLLDLLPGIQYTPGMWIPPFCVITTDP